VSIRLENFENTSLNFRIFIVVSCINTTPTDMYKSACRVQLLDKKDLKNEEKSENEKSSKALSYFFLSVNLFP